MGRIHLFEIADQPWCPQILRQYLTDWLRFATHLGQSFAPAAPLLAEVLQQTGERRVVDLCSGSGGPWDQILPALIEADAVDAVHLTDLRPRDIPPPPDGSPLRLHGAPVDATDVPEELVGFRTMFNAFHHFQPDEARSILRAAVDDGVGIAVFEGVERTAALIVPSLVLIPLMVLLGTPFMRPFSVGRLALTYLVPVMPVLILWDGIVSCLRVYSPSELDALIAGVDGAGRFEWRTGRAAVSRMHSGVTYVIGVPRAPEEAG